MSIASISGKKQRKTKREKTAGLEEYIVPTLWLFMIAGSTINEGL
jgi:hypothetical protein